MDMNDLSTHQELVEIPYSKALKDAINQLPKGAFLTVKQKGEVNTMTIGWGTLGVMWGRNVLVVGIRPSRYTYQFVDIGTEFTVSIPLDQKLKKQLNYCGTHSGKHGNKVVEAGLTLIDGKKVSVPCIDDCGLHFECKVIAKHQLIPEYIDQTIKDRHYSDGDHHMIFYGEIKGTYKKNI